MKKLFHKFRTRNEPPLSSRITSETVAEHRALILAGGRRFKYPIQYERHKLVINAIIISIVAITAALIIGWWQLYPQQNTSEFMYRLTRVLPVPVANVDGQPVLYSDYLMKYLSSVHYLEQKEQVSLKTDDGKRQIEYVKQQSMQDAIADAYARKIAKKLDISVSDSELEGFLKEQRQTADGEISEQTYNAVILDYYNWSPSEYRYVTEIKLLRQKVTYAMDSDALSVANVIGNSLKNNPTADFKGLADSTPSQSGAKAIYGTSSGWVPKSNQDGGLAIAASKLSKTQVSSLIKSTTGSGYYFVKLLDINADQVSYEYIQVPLTTFSSSLSSVIKDNKVDEYITIPETVK
jgi:hypothetical protein